jgi:hypothetical protein
MLACLRKCVRTTCPPARPATSRVAEHRAQALRLLDHSAQLAVALAETGHLVRRHLHCRHGISRAGGVRSARACAHALPAGWRGLRRARAHTHRSADASLSRLLMLMIWLIHCSVWFCEPRRVMQARAVQGRNRGACLGVLPLLAHGRQVRARAVERLGIHFDALALLLDLHRRRRAALA